MLGNIHFLLIIDKWSLHQFIIIPFLDPLQCCSQVYFHTISSVWTPKLWCTKRFLINLNIQKKKKKKKKGTQNSQLTTHRDRNKFPYETTGALTAVFFFFLTDFFFFSIGSLCKLWNLLPRSTLINICKVFIQPHPEFHVLFDQAFNNSFNKKNRICSI